MYISMGQRHDYRDLMRKVTAPVLVIHGADDLQSESASRIYSDTFPNAQFTVIKNAGHFSFQQQPEEFAGIVANFLKGK
jgi:pimeloyl-ACP methyl ester carboxylesterase